MLAVLFIGGRTLAEGFAGLLALGAGCLLAGGIASAAARRSSLAVPAGAAAGAVVFLVILAIKKIAWPDAPTLGNGAEATLMYPLIGAAGGMIARFLVAIRDLSDGSG